MLLPSLYLALMSNADVLFEKCLAANPHLAQEWQFETYTDIGPSNVTPDTYVIDGTCRFDDLEDTFMMLISKSKQHPGAWKATVDILHEPELTRVSHVFYIGGPQFNMEI